MTVVVAVLAAAIPATVYFLLSWHSRQAAAWTQERSELLDRIQRPDQLPARPVTGFEQPEFEPDDINQIGQIAWLPSEDS